MADARNVWGNTHTVCTYIIFLLLLTLLFLALWLSRLFLDDTETRVRGYVGMETRATIDVEDEGLGEHLNDSQSEIWV